MHGPRSRQFDPPPGARQHCRLLGPWTAPPLHCGNGRWEGETQCTLGSTVRAIRPRRPSVGCTCAFDAPTRTRDAASGRAEQPRTKTCSSAADLVLRNRTTPQHDLHRPHHWCPSVSTRLRQEYGGTVDSPGAGHGGVLHLQPVRAEAACGIGADEPWTQRTSTLAGPPPRPASPVLGVRTT